MDLEAWVVWRAAALSTVAWLAVLPALLARLPPASALPVSLAVKAAAYVSLLAPVNVDATPHLRGIAVNAALGAAGAALCMRGGLLRALLGAAALAVGVAGPLLYTALRHANMPVYPWMLVHYGLYASGAAVLAARLLARGHPLPAVALGAVAAATLAADGRELYSILVYGTAALRLGMLLGTMEAVSWLLVLAAARPPRRLALAVLALVLLANLADALAYVVRVNTIVPRSLSLPPALLLIAAAARGAAVQVARACGSPLHTPSTR